MTFSANTSEEIGGKEATLRFRLYRLGKDQTESTACVAYDLLPITPHMTALKLAAPKCYLASIACIWVRLGRVRDHRRFRRGGRRPASHDACHDSLIRENYRVTKAYSYQGKFEGLKDST